MCDRTLTNITFQTVQLANKSTAAVFLDLENVPPEGMDLSDSDVSLDADDGSK
jgi:hypothetical protein